MKLPRYSPGALADASSRPSGSPPSGRITALLRRWQDGDTSARDELLPLVYSDLKRRAGAQLRHERPDHTLEPAALVNEAYLRLADAHAIECQDRAHFLGLASAIMRRVLVDHARARVTRKRGGQARRLLLDDALLQCAQRGVDVLALDAALEELATLDPTQARIVELRFFTGLSIEETAGSLGVSTATVKRQWRIARAMLYSRLAAQDEE